MGWTRVVLLGLDEMPWRQELVRGHEPGHSLQDGDIRSCVLSLRAATSGSPPQCPQPGLIGIVALAVVRQGSFPSFHQ